VGLEKWVCMCITTCMHIKPSRMDAIMCTVLPSWLSRLANQESVCVCVCVVNGIALLTGPLDNCAWSLWTTGIVVWSCQFGSYVHVSQTAALVPSSGLARILYGLLHGISSHPKGWPRRLWVHTPPQAPAAASTLSSGRDTKAPYPFHTCIPWQV
jgi:hypothetical protein